VAAFDLDTLHAQLEMWAAAHYHEGVTVPRPEVMPGHAGLSFGFRVEHLGDLVDELVVRLPPKGVRRSGNTDVLRQVPLLRALGAAGVPVPPVPWFDDDERWFGVPYLMTTKLPGSTYQVRDPHPSVADIAPGDALGQALEALATIHTFDWRTHLADWEPEKQLVDEIRFWDPILAKSADPSWIGLGEGVRDRLLASVPVEGHVGVFHGDFQTNNVLFHEGRLVAVLDWEISGIGDQLLDVGWLLMMNDAASWAHGADIPELPPFGDLVARYAGAVGRPVEVDDVAWFRALAGYRFGVISCFNVMLHRTGKRPDAEWENIAPSVEYLFGRAADLLDGVGGRSDR
jgi:aminoglycoside phosphotransferase (APT) family kinase protein